MPFEAYAFSLSKQFDPAPTIVNIPRLDWTYPSAAQAGKPFRLVGRKHRRGASLPDEDAAIPLSYGGFHREETLIVARLAGTTKFIDIPVEASSGYEARLELPRSLNPALTTSSPTTASAARSAGRRRCAWTSMQRKNGRPMSSMSTPTSKKAGRRQRPTTRLRPR
jgi:hypothetical protein